jgi:hypothetical protein
MTAAERGILPRRVPAYMLAVLGMVLGKRPRKAEEIVEDGHQLHPSRKGKGKMAVNGVLEATGS